MREEGEWLLQNEGLRKAGRHCNSTIKGVVHLGKCACWGGSTTNYEGKAHMYVHLSYILYQGHT